MSWSVNAIIIGPASKYAKNWIQRQLEKYEINKEKYEVWFILKLSTHS